MTLNFTMVQINVNQVQLQNINTHRVPSFWIKFKIIKNVENHKNDQKNPKSTPNLLKFYRSWIVRVTYYLLPFKFSVV